MLIAASEGQGWRYEVVDDADGFLVISRDRETGAVEAGEGMVFRSAPVAFAFADLSAAFDRLASARLAGERTEELADELLREQSLYAELSRRFRDEGFSAALLAKEATRIGQRRLH